MSDHDQLVYLLGTQGLDYQARVARATQVVAACQRALWPYYDLMLSPLPQDEVGPCAYLFQIRMPVVVRAVERPVVCAYLMRNLRAHIQTPQPGYRWDFVMEHCDNVSLFAVSAREVVC